MRTKIRKDEIRTIVTLRNKAIKLAYKFDGEDDIDMNDDYGSVCSHIDCVISHLNAILGECE